MEVLKRNKEFSKIKELIKNNYKDADCVLFDTKNIVGDYIETIFKGEFFTLDICYGYSYFEVFGTTQKEFEELQNFYKDL